MLNKYKKFKGGYRFRRSEGIFANEVQEAVIPTTVTIPLKLRFGSTITPLVKKGDKVRAGQIIARNDDTISSPALASVNGVVDDIRVIDYFYGRVEAVIIKSDGTADYQRVKGACVDFGDLGFEKLSELLYITGAASLGKSGIPTIHKSSPARPKSIDNLIITTFGTGPFALDEMILFKRNERFFYKGLEILKHVLPNADITIAIDKDNKNFKKEIIDSIRRGVRTLKVPSWIFVQPLKNKYPQESEDMLTRIILKRKIPIGGLSTDIGVLILDMHDVLRVYDAVAEGKPAIERTVAVAGSACKENKFINVRVGASIQEVVKGNLKDNVEPRAIFGNCMTGLFEKNFSTPVGRSISHITLMAENRDRQFLSFMKPGINTDSHSNAFVSSYLPLNRLLYNTNMHGELRPCIQCSYCEDVCPVNIIPHLLSKQIKHDVCEGTEKLGIFDCIDCGLCSYVCPCKIPIAEDIYKGKKRLIEEGCTVPMVKLKESEEAVRAYRGRVPL